MITSDIINSSKLPKNVVVFKPSGRLDAESYYGVRNEVMALANTKPDVLVMDLENIDFIDSRGLGLLVTILKTMRVMGGKLVLCSVGEQVQILLKLTSTESLFETYAQFPADFN